MAGERATGACDSCEVIRRISRGAKSRAQVRRKHGPQLASIATKRKKRRAGRGAWNQGCRGSGRRMWWSWGKTPCRATKGRRCKLGQYDTYAPTKRVAGRNSLSPSDRKAAIRGLLVVQLATPPTLLLSHSDAVENGFRLFRLCRRVH